MEKSYEVSEAWVREQEKELFQTDKFREMSKGDDYVFQALSFIGNGSHKLSIATTILRNLNEVPKDLKEELKSIQQQLHQFNEKLREIKNEVKTESLSGYKHLKETLFKNIAGQEPFFVGQQEALLNEAEKILLTQEKDAEDITAAAYAKCINELICKAEFPKYYVGISSYIMSYLNDSKAPSLRP